MSLPSDKLHKLKSVINSFLSAKKVTLQELQSLIGLLNFACKVVAPGHAYCRRLINATIGISKPHHRIRLNNNIKQDLRIWQISLQSIMVFLLYEPNFWIVNPYSSSQTVQGVRMGVLVSISVVGGHMEHGLTLGFYRVLPGI